MSIYIYVLYTLLNLALVGWGIVVWRRTRRIGSLLLVAVIFGLVYDNLILAVGNLFGSEKMLYWFSIPRYVLHQLVLPWIMLVSFEQVRLLGQAWAQGRGWRWAAIGLSAVVMVLGILTRLVPMELELVEMDGVMRYVDVGSKGPPIVSIVSVGFVLVMGLLLWRKNHFPWLFLTALLVFIGEGIPLEWVRRILGSGTEVLFMGALLVLEERISRNVTD